MADARARVAAKKPSQQMTAIQIRTAQSRSDTIAPAMSRPTPSIATDKSSYKGPSGTPKSGKRMNPEGATSPTRAANTPRLRERGCAALAFVPPSTLELTSRPTREACAEAILPQGDPDP